MMDTYSQPAHLERAKDDNYLPCFYSPPVNDYCRALVRPEDFKEKLSRKRTDGTRKPSVTVIKRQGECFFDADANAWIFRTLDDFNDGIVKGEDFRVRYENLEFS